jgi:predicted alpha/beta-hydrolase family hydrolase
MVEVQSVPTTAGTARIHWHRSSAPHAVLALGHGSATGVDSPDLQALAAALPALGVTVALVEQPWRVSGSSNCPPPETLDAAWTQVWPVIAGTNRPVIAGGRSAGSQVACRTAAELGASAVLALGYPIKGPGTAAELHATGLPILVVQGGADPFGSPQDFPPPPADVQLEMATIPLAGHMFTVPGGHRQQRAALSLITESVSSWLRRQLDAVHH